MLKFYVLVSANRFALKRHERSIPKEDMVVIINTKDPQFEKDAVTYCATNNIEHYVTKSDGTPSTGKNRLLDIFEKSPYDHAVMVDGDDVITEYGVFYYKSIAASENPPDAVALKNQQGLELGLIHYSSNSPEPEKNEYGDVNPNSLHPRIFMPFRQRNVLDHYIKHLPKGSVPRDWAEYCIKYIDVEETHFRVTFISKKAASMYRFNDLLIGEDTCMFLNYKDAHNNGKLQLVYHDEKDNPTYLYDTRLDGIVEKTTADARKKGEVPAWLGTLVNTYKEYEKLGKLWEVA